MFAPNPDGVLQLPDAEDVPVASCITQLALPAGPAPGATLTKRSPFLKPSQLLVSVKLVVAVAVEEGAWSTSTPATKESAVPYEIISVSVLGSAAGMPAGLISKGTKCRSTPALAGLFHTRTEVQPICISAFMPKPARRISRSSM